MDCGCNATFVGATLANSCGGGSAILFMTLLNNFITNRCDISELCERVKPRNEPDFEYDFVVIGSGSGGSVVASRLSEVPQWKVLLIEAGGDEPPGTQVPSMVSNFLGNSDVDWMYKTEPEPSACLGNDEKRCGWPRGKVLGGTSVLNGMMYMRGQPRDYENWKRAGNEGWGYEDVLPVFKKSEDNLQIGSLVDGKYHGKGGYLTTSRFPNQPEITDDILDAARELGYPISNDLTGEQYSGFAIAQMTVRNGTRLSSARAFLRPKQVRERPNLHVLLNSVATKLIFNQSNKKTSIRAVELLTKGKKFVVGVKKEAILSGGAINSPQILLLSGVGPKNELDKVGIRQLHDLPGVGANLQNHVAFYMVFNLLKQKNTYDLDWPAALTYILNKNGPLSSTGMSQITARINSKYAEPNGTNPDLQIFFGGYSANCAETGEVYALRNPKDPKEPRSIYLSPVALHTKSRGKIALKSTNPLDHPLIYANYLTAPEDMAVMIDGVRVCQKLSNTKVMKEKYGMEMAEIPYGDCKEKHQFDSDDYWDCAIRHATGPENHQSGTCKMGPSTDPMAVVDPKLQVYGIEGLRVMDASVMPELVSGNTHATIIMIAEKGTDMIKEKWVPKNIINRFGSDSRNPTSGTTTKPPCVNHPAHRPMMGPYPGFMNGNHPYGQNPPPHHHYHHHHHHNHPPYHMDSHQGYWSQKPPQDKTFSYDKQNK